MFARHGDCIALRGQGLCSLLHIGLSRSGG